jgi:Ca2+-transporting ATPase
MDYSGLTEAQVRQSRQTYGSNAIEEQKQETFLQKLGKNFRDPIIRILLVALAINVLFTMLGQVSWYDSVGIAIAVALATLVSTYSEYQNESAFQALKRDAMMIRSKVYRDGHLREVPQEEIVVGDEVFVQLGDRLPADGILIDGALLVDQSVLNGEAREAEKTPAPPDDRGAEKSMDFLHPHKVFRGSVVTEGNAVMKVTGVGRQTVYGKLAAELQQDRERETPLGVKLSRLAQDISRFGYAGGVAIAVVVMLQKIFFANDFSWPLIAAYLSNPMGAASDLVNALILAVVIIVMAVPEGLPLMIAIVSAQNMGKMLRDNVLVRKLSGIETAGSLNLLFTDKTGTITKGKLEVVGFVDGKSKSSLSFAALSEAQQRLLSLSILCNTSAVMAEGLIVGGNTTERALAEFLPESLRRNTPGRVLKALPFNSRNKFSCASVALPAQQDVPERTLTLVKGAPEKLLPSCCRYVREDGSVAPWTAQDREEVEQTLHALARRAIRVLAFALKEGTAEGEAMPEELTLLGIVGIRDEVRPESVKAIAEVHRAGVQVVMITGDRPDTARAVAEEAGILDCGDALILTSEQLSALTDAELAQRLPQLRVVARALPMDKSRLVRLAQSLNLVVGMTGDGVNDALALKAADVGFSMGSGTEVAKEASEIVLLDDNFHSLERAVLYGRTIYNNIRKFIVFQLTINVGAVFTCFAAPFFGIDEPLSITQILWVNLIMDTLAALAFGGEPALAEYLREPPKRRDEHIVSRRMAEAIGTDGLWLFAGSLVFLLTPWAAAHFRPAAQDAYLLTGYFAFFVFMAIWNAFNVRTRHIHLLSHLGENKGFLFIMGFIFLVQVLMTQFGGAIMRCYGLLPREWSFVLLASLSIVPVDLLRKLLLRGR